MISTTNNYGLSIVTKDVPRIDSRLLAKNLNLKHKNLYELIKDHQFDFEEFGKVRFETEALSTSKTGQKEKYVLLNEDQAFLVLTYSRNNIRVRELKVKMVKAFSAARRTLEIHVNEYLPSYHEHHDLIKNMGLPSDKEKFLHMNTNKLVNQCMGISAGERGALSLTPKSCLVIAHAITSNAMRGTCDHKIAYQNAKVALAKFGELAISNDKKIEITQ